MISALRDGVSRWRTRRATPSSAAAHDRGEAGAVPGVVTVDYQPKLDGDADPGEIVWTWVTFEDDPAQGKDRPVVVIGRVGSDLAAIGLTSHGPAGRDDRIPVGTGTWDSQQRPSFAKVDRILTVDPARVRREGAVFERDRFEALITEVARRHPLSYVSSDPFRRPRTGRGGRP